MSLELIDLAIQRHLDWIQNFDAALSGIGRRQFDPQEASNDKICALGHWFSDPESLDLLGEDFHQRSVAIHAAFHEIAGEVIASLEASDPPAATQGLLDALKDLSKSLIEFLEFARKRLSGAPAPWKKNLER